MPDARILSIQSHVVRGYVGNKSATFPLQVLGFEVDAINSVQFSNHTQYKHFAGQVLKSDELTTITDGLRKNNLLSKYTHLLTGYIGDATFLRKAAELTRELKAVNPDLKYVCDPVMGDNGRFYVKEELLPIYQNEILPLADILTPNQFEIEHLTGIKIESIADAVKAIKRVHEMGPKIVVISSSNLGGTDHLLMLASDKTGNDCCIIQQKIPLIPASFVGTGDLFAALLLAWLEKTQLPMACRMVISTMQHVLVRTLQSAVESCGAAHPTYEQLELRLIQSIKDIENPTMEIPKYEEITDS